MDQSAHSSVDHFICLPNNRPRDNENLTDAPEHIYAVVNTSEGPQRARILRSSSNRDSAGSVISNSSIVSSSGDPQQRRSASLSSTSTSADQQHLGANKLAPNLIDLIPPPPAYPPPNLTDGNKSVPVLTFSVQPSIRDIIPTGI